MDEAPPHNVEAERELLGALLAFWSPEVFGKVHEVLEDSGLAFYDPRHRIAYRGISAVWATGAHVDLTVVSYFLSGQRDAQKRSYLDLAGGDGYMAILVSHAVPYGVVERALIVAKDAEWRRRLRMHREAAEACLLRDDMAYGSALGKGRAVELRLIEGGEAVAS